MINTNRKLLGILLFWVTGASISQLPPVFTDEGIKELSTAVKRTFLSPIRIVSIYDNRTGKQVLNAENILIPGIGQPDCQQSETGGRYLSGFGIYSPRHCCTLISIKRRVTSEDSPFC